MSLNCTSARRIPLDGIIPNSVDGVVYHPPTGPIFKAGYLRNEQSTAVGAAITHQKNSESCRQDLSRAALLRSVTRLAVEMSSFGNWPRGGEILQVLCVQQ